MPSVIITGADRGFGFFLCKEFLSRGWTVFAGKFLDDYNLLEQARSQLTACSKNQALHIVPMNLGDRSSIIKAFDFAAQHTNSLDMFVSNAAIMGQVQCSLVDDNGNIGTPLDLQSPWENFLINALAPTRMVEIFLPLFDKGEMKRLCFVSSEVSCISLMKHRAGGSYPYPMSKSSLNMSVRLMHNLLYPQGYSFRLYHPGWMKKQLPNGTLSELEAYNPEVTASHAAKYFETPLRDEHRLVMFDYLGQEWPF